MLLRTVNRLTVFVHQMYNPSVYYNGRKQFLICLTTYYKCYGKCAYPYKALQCTLSHLDDILI